jgi:uncharacterized protein
MTQEVIGPPEPSYSAREYLQQSPKTGPAYRCGELPHFLRWLAWRSGEQTALEDGKVMKAFLVLAAVYVGVFLIAIQGASQTSAEGVAPKTGISHIDPAKEADIRSLMDLIGARSVVKDDAAKNAVQIRENLVATMPASDRGQQFVDAFVADYQKKFHTEEVTSQLVGIYDKHFTDDEVKGLLQFYGSPLGRKYAVEMPKISSEIQAANHAVSTRVAKNVLQDLPNEYLGIGTPATSLKPQAGVQTTGAPGKQTAQTSAHAQPESMASASQP